MTDAHEQVGGLIRGCSSLLNTEQLYGAEPVAGRIVDNYDATGGPETGRLDHRLVWPS